MVIENKSKLNNYIERLNSLCWNSLFDTGYDSDDSDLIEFSKSVGIQDSDKFVYKVHRRIAPRIPRKARRIR